jgi:hypothetical protein
VNVEERSAELSDEASTASMDQPAPAQTSGGAARAGRRATPDVKLEVRTVPISADQIKALESLERALDAVERGELLSGACAAHVDAAREPFGVEGVQRVAELPEHVVGDVDHV